MDEKNNVKNGLELNGTSAGNGFFGDEKEAELLPTVLPSSDESGTDAGIDDKAPLKRRGEIRWVAPWL